MWLLLVACASTQPFSCGDAAAALGHPSSTVDGCDAAPNLPEIYQIALTGGDVTGRLVVGAHLADGKLDPARGNAAFVAFLEGLGERRRALTMQDVMATLRAFDAFPKGFDGTASMFNLPAIGTSSFTPEPFRLQIYNGRPPEPGFVRAELTGPPWVWSLSELPDGATEWKTTGNVPL